MPRKSVFGSVARKRENNLGWGRGRLSPGTEEDINQGKLQDIKMKLLGINVVVIVIIFAHISVLLLHETSALPDIIKIGKIIHIIFKNVSLYLTSWSWLLSEADSSTCSGGTVRGLERRDLQQHNAPLSYQRLAYGYHTGASWRKPLSLPLQHTYLKVVGSNPVTGKNFFGTKFNCSHEGMIPMLKLTFLSYFFPIELVWCYLDPSFLLFLLPLESSSKLYIVPALLHTDFPIFLFYPILTSQSG